MIETKLKDDLPPMRAAVLTEYGDEDCIDVRHDVSISLSEIS